MSLVTINDEYLSAIGTSIRNKNGTTDLIKPKDMAAAIDAITGGGSGVDPALLNFTGDCSYLFSNKQIFNILAPYLDQMTFTDVYNCEYMFRSCPVEDLSNLTINLYKETRYSNFPYNIIDGKYMFYGCSYLKEFPQFGYTTNLHLADSEYMFYGCYRMREVPDWINNIASPPSEGFYLFTSNMFANCHSLRSVPADFLAKVCSTYRQSGTATSPITQYGSSIGLGGFKNCYALDELKNVSTRINYTVEKNETAINSDFVARCSRLKSLTFDSANRFVDNVLDLSDYVGWAYSATNITGYNSGITADKEVVDDATYQALKNDPDWFTCDVAYSRYNHTSAVETINSLPDMSDYGTNTIKFKSAAGSKTDGGSISNLTPAEISVATAKGWTVSLV